MTLREPPGPGMLETYRRLRKIPLHEFPIFLSAVSREYGAVVQFAVPWRRFYFFNDPALIKEVLVTQQHAFVKSEGTRVLSELLGKGLVTSEEPQHRRSRRIVQPAFHKARIAGYAQTMQRYADEWEPPAGAFDMHAAMMQLTLRIASTTLFGVDAGSQSERVSHALRDVVEAFPDVLGPFGRIKRLLPLPPVLRFRRARRLLDEIVLELIAHRRRQSEDRGDALSMLLASHDEGGGALDDRQVRDEVMTLFVAGHETTANLLLWAWYLLAKHPACAEQLREDLRAAEHPPYLDAVLEETLRLYPPVWVLGREAKAEVGAGGWRVRKGATVLMSQLVLHRTAATFEEPDAFRPERWLARRDLEPFAFLPFGAGSRKCIGDEFARTEARIVLASLARRFSFELDPPELTVAPMPIVTLRPAEPVPMRAVQRQ